MVVAFRCSYCGANIEIADLDNREEYKEVFQDSGCESSGCAQNFLPGRSSTELDMDYTKTPERLLYEAIMGTEEVEPGYYEITLEGEDNDETDGDQ